MLDLNAVYENIIDMSKTDNVKVENNVKINSSDKVLAERTVDNMIMKNISLTSDGNSGVTGFTAIVENPTDADYAGGDFIITFLNNDGNEFDIMNLVIDPIPAHSTTDVGTYTGADVANAYDFTITKQ